MFINDFPDVISSQLVIFTDDTTIYPRLNNRFDKVKLSPDFENDHKSVVDWDMKRLVTFNASKTETAVFLSS